MPLIRISQAAEYDPERKARIVREVTAAYARASGCDPAKVWLVLDQVSREDWGTGGVTLAAQDR